MYKYQLNYLYHNKCFCRYYKYYASAVNFLKSHNISLFELIDLQTGEVVL